MKLKDIVEAYNLLDEAKITTLDDKDGAKILNNRKTMRPHIQDYNEFLKDAIEKFKPENMEELREQMNDIKALSSDKQKEVISQVQAYEKRINAVCDPEVNKDMSLTLEKLSVEASIRLAKENGWPLSKLDLLNIMID